MSRELRSFFDINLLFEAARKQIASLNRNQVATWLANQESYSLHKVPRKHFKRNNGGRGRGGYIMTGRLGKYATIFQTL